MEWTGWAVIILLLVAVYAYKSPDNYHNYVSEGIDKVNSMVHKNQSTACNTQYDPVCGENNQTYSNICLAQQAGIKNAVMGVCA